MRKHFMLLNTALLLTMALHPLLLAQNKKPVSLKSSAKPVPEGMLPLDPAVRTGKLPNGFSYFIRKNTEPKNRVVMYLVNKVGSILENDDQRGLAHFMEHMSFNGTVHFPKNELVSYLQKSGIRFGADLNAYTGFDETVYQLPLPTDDPRLLHNGFQIMRDWAQGALLDTAEITKEVGVVMEEKRLGKGAGERMQRKFLPVLLNQSRYANRIPIGTDEVLTNFKAQTLRDFYKDWYRPDLQALIVVGDIDIAETEKKIRAMFADLKNPAKERARTKYKVDLAGKNHFLVVTDKEMTSTSLNLIIKQKGAPVKTAADYRYNLMVNLFNQMLGNRYSEVARQPDPPFIQAGAEVSDLQGGLKAYSAAVTAKPGQAEVGFKALWRETQRVSRYGFTATELQRAKSSYISNIVSAYKERGKTNSANYVDEYTQYFLGNAAAPGIEAEFALVKHQLPGVTLTEVNSLIKKYIKSTDRDIILMGPEKDKAQLPDEATVNSWLADVKKEQLAPYQDNASNKPLIASKPVPGKIVSEKVIAELGITELKFTNGVTVLLKPTNFKNDEIIFNAVAPGGTSLYSDADYESAANASSIVTAGGAGEFTDVQLEKLLAGKQLGVLPYISDRIQGISGFTSPKDLETALQLTYVYFTRPRKDSSVFKSIIERTKASIVNREANPTAVFGDTVAAVLGNYNIRRTGPSISKIEQINLDKAFKIYQERFADAANFTFVFVGSFNTAHIKPLLQQYLATLPAINKKEQARDMVIIAPPGKIKKTVYKGSEPKATVRLVFAGDYDYTRKNNKTMDALAEVLEIRLLERLREDESGVYSPGAFINYNKYPKQRTNLTITFGCAPQNAEKLIASTLDELQKLRENGPSQENVDKYKAETRRSMETLVKTNGYWSSAIYEQLLDNESLQDILSDSTMLENLSVKDIREAARKYLDGKNFIRLVLMPENNGN